MANDERDQITTSNDQVSNNSGTLGGMTDKLSSAVGGTQGSENAQSYIGKGKSRFFKMKFHFEVSV